MVHVLKPKHGSEPAAASGDGDNRVAPTAPADPVDEAALPEPQVIREQFEQYRRSQLQMVAQAIAALEADRADLHRQYQEAMAQLKERIIAYRQVGAELEAQAQAARAAVARPRQPAPGEGGRRGNGDETPHPSAPQQPRPAATATQTNADADDGDDEESRLKADGRRIVTLLRQRAGWVSVRELARLTRNGQVEQALSTFSRDDFEVRGYGVDAEYRWIGM